jgi:hypothetical protein
MRRQIRTIKFAHTRTYSPLPQHLPRWLLDGTILALVFRALTGWFSSWLWGLEVPRFRRPHWQRPDERRGSSRRVQNERMGQAVHRIKQ